MKTTNSNRMLSLILCVVLAWTVALFTVGCSDNNTETPKDGTAVTTTAATTAAATEAATEGTTEGTTAADTAVATAIGEGTTAFSLAVVDGDGAERRFEVSTDKATVGEALLELGLISGEEGDFGLYIKEVCGITADYGADGTYWAFYVNGEYAMSGVDLTEIEAGAAYALKVEK